MNIKHHISSSAELPDKLQWETLKVALIATGSPTEDRKLASTARAQGLAVLLKDLPDESDFYFTSKESIVYRDIEKQTKSLKNTNTLSTIWGSNYKERTVNILAIVALMLVGHLIFSYFTLHRLSSWAVALHLTNDFFYYVLGGFVAQMIDGALGMAYGVTATTFLLTLGVPPSAVSASVHSSEIFTSGVSGYLHLKFGNVNSKLFKSILIPGIIGGIAGAVILTSTEQYLPIIRPIVAVYTLILGILIIKKALIKRIEKRPIKNIGWLAFAGGSLDSIGGGGWGPIVSSTLIARGRHPKYTIGSVNLAEFFVSLASSITFASIIGIGYWQVIVGLILGGLIAAPIAAHLSRKLPIKTMMIFVGVVVIVVSLRIIVKLFI